MTQEERIAKLEKTVAKLVQQADAIDMHVGNVQQLFGKRMDAMKKITAAIDPAEYNLVRERHATLASLFEKTLHRYTVITELMYYSMTAPQFTTDAERLKAIKGMLYLVDSDDEWWVKHSDKPLQYLLDVVLKESK